MSKLSHLLRGSKFNSWVAPIRTTQGIWQAGHKQLCISPEEAQLSATSPAAVTTITINDLSRQLSSSSPASPSLLSLASHPPRPSLLATYSAGNNNASAPVLCSLLDLLSLQHKEVRLPCAVPSARIETPHSVTILPQELPRDSNAITSLVDDDSHHLPAVLPSPDEQVNLEKLCVNMLRVRKEKMKKHQRQKEYRRNRIGIEHSKLLRKIQFEKAFMNDQLVILQKAESFNAAEYVQQRLDLKNNRPVPKFYGGKRLPEVCVMEIMLENNRTIPGTEDDSDYSYDNKPF